ncbi:hypothetical protein FJ364_00395, partial [Candidatus Dependentiae bacterium]|nr:hypothetical protein [Candidatus Dependentiae bacterium]
MTPFFIRSTNGSDLRHYFFPGGKDELVIKGSEPGGSCDVSGTWLRIVGTNGTPEYSLLKNSFQSTFQINPVYTYMGVHFHVRKQVGNWWGDMQLPVAQVSVEHKMKEYGLSGNVVSLDDIDAFGEGNRKASITDEYSVDAVGAFSNATLQYHKLSKKTLTHYGMGDATIKLGRNHGRMQYFTKFVLPTSQPPTNECMFEPQLGN